MASALITLTFLKHNENILAKSEGRVPNPVEAYGCLSTDTKLYSTEYFGLYSPSSVVSVLQSSPSACKCLLKDLKFNKVTAIFESAFSSQNEDALCFDEGFYKLIQEYPCPATMHLTFCRVPLPITSSIQVYRTYHM